MAAKATKWKLSRYSGTMERSMSVEGLSDPASGSIWARITYYFERYADGGDIPATGLKPGVGLWLPRTELYAYLKNTRYEPVMADAFACTYFLCVEDTKQEVQEGTDLIRQTQVWEAVSDWVEIENDFTAGIVAVGDSSSRYTLDDIAQIYGSIA